MEAVNLRESVLDYIKNKADNQFLKLVKAMANTYQEEPSERISVEQYNKELDESIAQIERGEFYTHQEVKERIQQWGKQ